MDNLRKEIMAKLRRPEVCWQRAYLLTRAYREHLDKPAIVRRAHALATVLREMDISIEPWQQIVGNFASRPFRTSVFPEYSWRWIMEEMDCLATREGDKFTVGEEARQKLEELRWWEGRSVQDKVMPLLTGSAREQIQSGVISSGLITSGIGQYLPGYERVIRRGIRGLKDDIADRMARLHPAKPGDFPKKAFYEALLIVCDGVVAFANRYASLARTMAKSSRGRARREELLSIARVCQRVPESSAATFQEAVQAFWFLHLVAYLEIDGAGIAAGRLDQILYPYFRRDLARGAMSRDGAAALLRSLWINFNQILTFYPEGTTRIWAGYPMTQQPSLGGVDRNGKDVVNELSELMLEVESEVRLPQPDIAILHHDHMDRNFFRKACRLLPGTMKPKFFNSGLAMEHLRAKGVKEIDVFRFSNIGCVTAAVAGTFWGPANCGFVSLAKCLELALHNGVDPVRKRPVGAATGGPDEFGDFEILYRAYCEQVEYAVEQLVTVAHALETVYREEMPLPYASLMVDDCIRKGRDVTSGGARYNAPGIQAVGLSTVADSLHAVRELIFREGRISLKGLVDVLGQNFEKNGAIRLLLDGAAKYGNDEDAVDGIARMVGEQFCAAVRRHRNLKGASFAPALYSISAHAGMGEFVGATPDGRRAHEPLADGISPAQGRCLRGPTAAIRSVCRLNHRAAINGNLLNMKFNEGMITDPEKLEKFMDLLDAFMEMGGYHVQFNIIDSALLREAQAHPERHPDLLVRVAAYVAQFAILPKRLQDDIIARSELGG